MVTLIMLGPFSSRTSITSAAAAAAAAASLYVSSPSGSGVPNLAGTLFDNQVSISSTLFNQIFYMLTARELL
jgi:hypothetical protein